MAAPLLDAEDYLAHQGDDQAHALRTLMDAIGQSFPELEMTLAWNVPHFRQSKDYVAPKENEIDSLDFAKGVNDHSRLACQTKVV